MAEDAESSDRGEPAERGAGEGSSRYSGFAGKLAAHARGRLPSFAGMRHGLGLRLLSSVLLFSACVTLILTLTQVYLEYRRDVSALELRLDQISESYLDSVAEGLWILDEKQLQLQLMGILRLPDIRAVEVREVGAESNPLVIRLGEISNSPAITRVYPLHYNVQGKDMLIGTLRVQASLADIHRRVFDTGLVILVTQAATIFLVSLFIVYIFHQLVTRHLFAIASYVDNYQINDPPSPMQLRRPPGPQDELQRVVTAFNALSDDLQTAYRDLRDVNDKLAQDVTIRRQVEIALREREARIRRLVDANIIGIYIADIDGLIVDANDAFLRIVGYDREDLVSGRISWKDLTPSEWAGRDEQAVSDLKTTGTAQPYEKEYFRKDGARVPVLIGVASIEDGARRNVVFVLDLTDQKRAEAALRASEEQWKAVFENNPTMFFIVDSTGAVLSVNHFGAERLGYATEELIGRPVEVLFHEADRESARRNKVYCLEHLGRTMTWELRKIRKGGEALWVRETARAMLIENQPVVLVVSEDITEGKRAAEALREVQMQLAHANRVATIGQLTASIAHEVNQPIAATVTNAQAALRWLGAEPANLDEVQQALGRIVRDGSRAGAVVGRIRNLIKKASRSDERLDINSAIREVIELTRSEAIKHGVRVQTELAEGLPSIQGDRVELQQVMLNLILNAVEAMSESSEGSRELLITTRRAETGDVLVAVRDSGPGLAPATLENLFAAFYTTKPNGLGLGLSICRSIVEARGGKLWASANAPRGAVFQFTLPAHPDGASRQ